MFHKVLVANRGAIACRIIRTLKRLGIGSVAVYSDADRNSLHVSQADESVRLGPGPAVESYLRQEALLAAARATAAQAIHPGYGFLSENAEFAAACQTAGIVFIGPTPAQMRDFGLKHKARELAHSNGVPLLPGSGLLDEPRGCEGPGRAHRISRDAEEHGRRRRDRHAAGPAMQPTCRVPISRWSGSPARTSAAAACFWRSTLSARGTSRCRYSATVPGGSWPWVNVTAPRSAEIRSSSKRRRRPGYRSSCGNVLFDSAVRLGTAVNYQSAGTVEFVLDDRHSGFLFSGSQHAPAGGARRHRRGDRHRSGRVDVASSGQ